ncbi:MAG: hypothetical protein OXP71_07605 [Candidatus Poribacteria bacterium]|nr:hypothetical protein [Candidatus Poribacteria bacterium]
MDTNVAKVANGREESPQASPKCVNTCINRLERIVRGEEKLVLDNKWKIMSEYRDNLRSSGEPGAGDRFFLWVLRRKDTECVSVPITPVDGLENEFREFPDDPALDSFDRDDRMFIAVALAHTAKPPILQAVDTQWWQFRDALRENGVTVEFICEDDIQKLSGDIGLVKVTCKTDAGL